MHIDRKIFNKWVTLLNLDVFQQIANQHITDTSTIQHALQSGQATVAPTTLLDGVQPQGATAIPVQHQLDTTWTITTGGIESLVSTENTTVATNGADVSDSAQLVTTYSAE